ncbi:MAG: hypothetical protein MO852_06165, partial [Candidatus Devosia euplotis]|nr:hypothetical protein [Candidatus Devosia euplotis]
PTCGAIAFVILRRAPIDAELSLFRSQDTIAAGPLFDWVADLAERQIFGAGRRPVVLAFKGA